MTPLIGTLSAATARGYGWLFIPRRDAVLPPAPGLYAWGYNFYGTLGLGNTTNRSSPVQVGTLTDWSKVSTMDNSSSAIKNSGSLWSWGYNIYGQLGLGDVTARSSPVQVGTLTNWSTVSRGRYAMMAIKTDGTLWGSGDNSIVKALGVTGSTYSSPVQVGALTTWRSVSIGNHTVATRTNGGLWAWGYNLYGQLGTNNTGSGDPPSTTSPVQVGALTDWSSEIDVGEMHTVAVKTNGTLWTWGDNSNGQLGYNTMGVRYYPDSYSCELDGVVCFGYIGTSATCDGCTTLYNNGGWAGLGCLGVVCNFQPAFSQSESLERSSPVQVGGLTNWSTVSGGGYTSYSIKTDGTLWAWGNNSNGQIGVNTVNINYSSPVQVGALTNWARVAASRVNGLNVGVLAVKTDGTLWAWGYNTQGELGLGNTTSYSSPIQVGTSTKWLSTAISMGSQHALAIIGT